MCDEKLEDECLEKIRQANVYHDQASKARSKTAKKELQDKAAELEQEANDLMEKVIYDNTEKPTPSSSSES